MLVLFLQDVLEFHDRNTSYFIWKVMFLLMDLDLFLVIPIGLIWDLFVQRQKDDALLYQKNSGLYLKKQLLTGVMFAFFASLFIVTYFIFNKYINITQIKQTIVDGVNGVQDVGVMSSNATASASPQQPRKIIRLFNFISSSNTQLEFFTIIGILFNALMQGYVCVNSIYVYLIQNLEQNPNLGAMQQPQEVLSKKVQEEPASLSSFEFHQRRITRILDGISFQKQNRAKLVQKFN